MSTDIETLTDAASITILEEILAPARAQRALEDRTRGGHAQPETTVALRGQVAHLAAELDHLTQAASATAIERDSLARRLSRRAAEMAALRAELESLDASAHEARRRLSHAEAERTTLEQEFSAVIGETSRLRAELAEARLRATATEDELTEVERELATVEQQSLAQHEADVARIRALRWQIAMFERQATAGRAEHEHLLAQHGELAREYEQLALEHRAATGELQQQLGDQQARAESLQASVEDLRASLEQAEFAGAEQERLARESEQLARSHGATIAQLQQQLQDEQAGAESLQASLDRVEQRLARRAAQLQAIHASRSFRIVARASKARGMLAHPVARRRARELPAAGESGQVEGASASTRDHDSGPAGS